MDVNLFLKGENRGRDGVECSFERARSALVESCCSLARRARGNEEAKRGKNPHAKEEQKQRRRRQRENVLKR